MKKWSLGFVLFVISLNVRGDIIQSEKIAIRVNNEKTAEVLMLFSDPKFYLGRLRFSPGGGVAEHNHVASLEVVYILAGTGEIVLAGKKSMLKAGDVIQIPVGMNHAFRNTGSEEVDVIQVYSPPGPEERFKAWPIKK
jgi:mannose-6-phosphate isomerase-like protein (cupin superfamily)